jgi:hypothetical protein
MKMYEKYPSRSPDYVVLNAQRLVRTPLSSNGQEVCDGSNKEDAV